MNNAMHYAGSITHRSLSLNNVDASCAALDLPNYHVPTVLCFLERFCWDNSAVWYGGEGLDGVLQKDYICTEAFFWENGLGEEVGEVGWGTYGRLHAYRNILLREWFGRVSHTAVIIWSRQTQLKTAAIHFFDRFCLDFSGRDGKSALR